MIRANPGRMALTPGTRIGACEITALIGTGGMGEVYRARDTRLNRDVALRVLPELFAADPERLARFKREAQLLASRSRKVQFHWRRHCQSRDRSQPAQRNSYGSIAAAGAAASWADPIRLSQLRSRSLPTDARWR
jgi:hypothetical protein